MGFRFHFHQGFRFAQEVAAFLLGAAFLARLGRAKAQLEEAQCAAAKLWIFPRREHWRARAFGVVAYPAPVVREGLEVFAFALRVFAHGKAAVLGGALPVALRPILHFLFHAPLLRSPVFLPPVHFPAGRVFPEGIFSG